MSEHSSRPRRRPRRIARQVGEEVAEELLLELVWRLLTTPFRLVLRGLANGLDVVSP